MYTLRLGFVTLVSLLFFSLPGCTWVPLTSGGESVRAISPSTGPSSSDASDTSGLEQCERVGAVTAQTRARVGIFVRSEEKILEELQALARNDAAEMGADHVIAEAPPSAEGRQRFTAYRCFPLHDHDAR